MHEIRRIIARVAKKSVGREGIFGSMSFSHDLLHQIGGEDDTNRNTTQRILLLLESTVVGRAEAYGRVVNNVLGRYIHEDRGFLNSSAAHHVPRFLLNDFARYWWTMAVDFAYKQRDRQGEGSALRNMKLRMSRKLIYVSGLLVCFGCDLGCPGGRNRESCPAGDAAHECVQCLKERLKQPPLEILAGTLLALPHLDESAKEILGAYDGFIGILADQAKRTGLGKLEPKDYESDPVYAEARDLSHRYRDGLLKLFFDQNSKMFELTKNYGVF